MLLEPHLRERKRYIVIKLVNNKENPKIVISKLNKIFGSYGLTKFGITVVKYTKNTLILRVKHSEVKNVLAGIFLLSGKFIPKLLNVSGTLKKSKKYLD